MKRRLFVVLLVAGIGIASYVYSTGSDAATPQVRTAPVTRGDIVTTVQATGTVQPVTTVTVGSQVSGVIAWLGADFNDIVRKGQVIARLDASLLQAQLDQALANLTKVRADVQQRTMTLADRQTKRERADRLAAGGLVSQSELEAATLAVEMARTDLVSIQAQVTQAQAAVNQARVNLNHTTITTPIDGIVVQRSVDVGQTVAASLSSPTIFLIAADLGEMEVVAGVDEGDISAVAPGQKVNLRVDAYPDEIFPGTVAQVRLQPTVVSNVTTYSTIIEVSNPAMKLKPGMTANATIEIERRDDVLRVPNTALRFRPTGDTFAAFEQAVPAAAPGRGAPSQVWVFADGGLRAIAVTLGLADGTFTEVVAAELEPGAQVVTTVTLPNGDSVAPAPARNIFAPPPSGRGRG